MKVAVISVFVDYHRRGAHHRSLLQPQAGPLIAALLPDGADIDVINDAWTDPDWSKRYDLVLLSCMHSDFDRARQIARYFQSRGAKTVLGGSMASSFPQLCTRYFDAVVVGDPEDTVGQVYQDAAENCLQPLYRSGGYQPALVPAPRVELSARQQVLPVALEVTRGCPFTCDFCALTGAGTRFETRPVESVVREIQQLSQSVRDTTPAWRRRLVMFYDNNLAGNFKYLRELCLALKPLDIRWGTCVTFNLLLKRDLLKLMYEAGCRTLFVGLESFNPDAIAGFNKHQNRLSEVRRALDMAREEGILVTSGLMVSPDNDDVEYIRSLPRHLKESGLHLPSFVCIETAIPGTPLFQRLAASHTPRFQPNAALHDFNAYTLVLQPQKATTDEFVNAYEAALKDIYKLSRKAGKLAHDLPALVRKGSWMAAAADMLVSISGTTTSAPGRTYVPATDIPPQEVVPLGIDDFDNEEELRRFMAPTMVTDAEGYVLPEWLDRNVPFERIRFRSQVTA